MASSGPTSVDAGTEGRGAFEQGSYKRWLLRWAPSMVSGQQATEQMREGISHMVKGESEPLPYTSFDYSGWASTKVTW